MIYICVLHVYHLLIPDRTSQQIFDQFGQTVNAQAVLPVILEFVNVLDSIDIIHDSIDIVYDIVDVIQVSFFDLYAFSRLSPALRYKYSKPTVCTTRTRV